MGNLIAGTLLIGIAIRARVQLVSPLPSDDPVRWFGWGLVQDLGAMSLAGFAVLSLARRSRTEPLARWLFGTMSLAMVVLSLVWSESLIYFGHPPQREDLAMAFKPSFVRESLDAGLSWRFVVVAFLFAAAALLARFLSLRATAPWARPRRLLWIGIAACGLSLIPIPIPIHMAESAENPLFGVPSMFRAAAVEKILRRPVSPRPANPTAVRELVGADPERRYFSERFPLAYFPSPASQTSSPLPPGMKPNIVFVVMEGVRANEVGSYGSPDLSITPRLDELARDGIRVERAVSPGTHTPEGELALWYGLLAVPGDFVLTRSPDLTLTGLPEILRAAGWKSFLWIHNSDQTFYGEDRFFRPRGFQTIDGRDFNRSDPRTNWGYSDRVLAARTAPALDRLQEPFAAMMLTISNHHPFQLPSDARTPLEKPAGGKTGFLEGRALNLAFGPQTERMRNTVRYTDDAVGEFFDLARTRPWFRRTVFLITSDHGLPIVPASGTRTLHEFLKLRHRVPLIFYSPLLTGGIVLPGPASLADVAPTLLELLRIPCARSGVGSDLFAPARRAGVRPIIAWNDESRTITIETETRIYHATAPPERDAGGDFHGEILIDPLHDPIGRSNLSRSEPGAVLAFRRTARIYLESYTALVLNGDSGVPRTPGALCTMEPDGTIPRESGPPLPLR